MREELLKISKSIDKKNSKHDYYYSDYSDMAKYIKKATRSIFKKRNCKELVDNLDIILSYTNRTNEDLIYIDDIHDQSHFISQLAKNISSFRYPEVLDDLFAFLNCVYKGNLFTKEMIEALTNLDLNQFVFTSIFNFMNEEQRMLFLQALYEKKRPIKITYGLNQKEVEFVISHYDDFVDTCENLFLLKGIVESFPDALKKINEYMNNNYDRVIDSIMEDICYLNTDNKDLRSFIYYLVKDVADSENIDYCDIRDNASGGYSVILFVGDKVIKIGKERKTPVFPNNPYIIKPLLRQEAQFGDDKIFVEVTEKVEANVSSITEEDLYQLYKGLRELGLVWTDIAKKNVGRLKKDNEIYWKENIKPSDETLGLTKFRGEPKTLKKDDYVILDADFIFSEGDPNISHVSYAVELEKKFEQRYQEEKGIVQEQKNL